MKIAVVVVNQGFVVVVEKLTADSACFSFPTAEPRPGETVAETARRLAKSDLGLNVEVQRQLAEVESQSGDELYFLATLKNPNDMWPLAKDKVDESPLWMPLKGLSSLAIHPREVALLVEYSGAGWPHEVLRLHNRARAQELVFA